ncbi:MAG: 50S ribosomal protein L9 [Micavibrio sp.]|nr:50S ribosomal protein L9 [Micavibrio sp.]|tara:strand:+ start:6010 stop:6774 length:765 start_codon:yes stop_codon:yes gene_type:complete
MAQTQVILLEKVDKLGGMGDVVTVKPGYARNYLLPQKKALRASKENVAYFDAQRKALEAQNEKTRKEAEKLSAKLKNVKAPVIRQASESGQLYGSVTARDIAAQINGVSDVKVDRTMIRLHDNFKTIGLFEVEVALHPEVVVPVIVNIARTEEEAKIQADTGRALIADADSDVPMEEVIEEIIAESNEENLETVLEDSALESEKVKKEQAAAKAAEDEAKAAKSAEKAAKKAAKKAAEAPEEEGEATVEIGASE